MILELKNRKQLLPLLYEDYVSYVEEISLIEETYLWDNVCVYVDNVHSTNAFLVIHSVSYASGRSISAYIKAENPSTIREFVQILRAYSDVSMHLQTSLDIQPYIEQFMDWLPKTYIVRYHRADIHTFTPHCIHRERAILLSTESIKKYRPSALYSKRLKTAQVYGYVNEEGRMIATSGIGYLTKKSFAISYTLTEPEYRNRGIAKCLTSLASEPLIKKGLIGIYGADITNKASVGVAQGLGFLPYSDMICFHNS